MVATTVREAVEAFLAHREPRVRPRSYETYEFWLNRWLRWRDANGYPVRLKFVSLAELQHYFRDMEAQGLKPASRDSSWRIIRALWTLLNRRKLLTPKQQTFFQEDGVARVTVPDDIQPIYTEATIQALLAACDKQTDEECAARNRAIIYLLWETGARAGELGTLTDEHTDVQRRHGVIDGKGGVPRWLRWDDGSAAALQAYLAVRTGPVGGPLLRNMIDGGPITVEGIRNMLARAARRAGVKLNRQSPIHSFRRTFAQEALEGGLADLELQQLMGHRTIVSTMRYTRRAPHRLDEVYKRMRANRKKNQRE